MAREAFPILLCLLQAKSFHVVFIPRKAGRPFKGKQRARLQPACVPPACPPSPASLPAYHHEPPSPGSSSRPLGRRSSESRVLNKLFQEALGLLEATEEASCNRCDGEIRNYCSSSLQTSVLINLLSWPTKHVFGAQHTMATQT